LCIHGAYDTPTIAPSVVCTAQRAGYHRDVSMLTTAVITGVVLSYVAANFRRGNVHKHFIGTSELHFTTRADPRLAFDTLKQIGRPYRVDDSDAATLRLVLSSGSTLFSPGFFYPVEIEAADGATKISVGVRGRMPFSGMIQTAHAHKRCLRAIEALFAAPPARLA
jgi:hypothetical protein